MQAALVTTRTMARWAEHYRMRLSAMKPTVPPAQLQKQLRLARRGGALPFEKIARTEEAVLPAGLAEREGLIDGFFEEFERHRAYLVQAEVSLYLGEYILLDQSDGMPGPLAASPEEFVQLQTAWEEAGLPRDLYYPVRDERMVIEPVEKYGGVVRTRLYYSPRQWEQRVQVKDAPLPIPSEEERLEAFIAACERFAQAVGLYIAQLSEPGQQAEQGKIQRLRAVFHDVHLAALRARETLLLPRGEIDVHS
jgi:hypothetical protein